MNVLRLPLNGHAQSNADVAAHLRQQADWIEEGIRGNVLTIVMVMETDDKIFRQTCGRTIDRARLVGLLEFAKHQAIEE